MINNGEHVRLVHNEQSLAEQVRVASSWLSRLKGLLGTRSLQAGHGIWLTPCNSIHMFGMLYPIDVVFLDKSGCVCKFKENVKPFSVLYGGKNAHSTIELPAFTLRDKQMAVGELVKVQ